MTQNKKRIYSNHIDKNTNLNMNKSEIFIIKELYKSKYTLIKKLKKEKELSINLYIRNDIFSAKKLISLIAQKLLYFFVKFFTSSIC